MAIENFDEVKTYFETNKDNQDIKNYIGGFITPDRVQSFLDTEEGKKIVQPKLDSHFTKGLETWKTNNLQKMIDEEINKRYPEESEEKKLLKKLQADLANAENARVRESLKNKAITHLTSKSMPVDLADYFLGNDEDSTTANLTKFESVWNSTIQKAVEEKFKENGRDPHKDDKNKPDFSKMTDEEYYAYQQEQRNKK